LDLEAPRMLRRISLQVVLSGRSAPIPEERVELTQKDRAGSVQPGCPGMDDSGSSINGDQLNRHDRDPTSPDPVTSMAFMSSPPAQSAGTERSSRRYDQPKQTWCQTVGVCKRPQQLGGRWTLQPGYCAAAVFLPAASNCLR
jgi:hypothetical protein